MHEHDVEHSIDCVDLATSSRIVESHSVERSFPPSLSLSLSLSFFLLSDDRYWRGWPFVHSVRSCFFRAVSCPLLLSSRSDGQRIRVNDLDNDHDFVQWKRFTDDLPSGGEARGLFIDTGSPNWRTGNCRGVVSSCNRLPCTRCSPPFRNSRYNSSNEIFLPARQPESFVIARTMEERVIESVGVFTLLFFVSFISRLFESLDAFQEHLGFILSHYRYVNNPFFSVLFSAWLSDRFSWFVD